MALAAARPIPRFGGAPQASRARQEEITLTARELELLCGLQREWTERAARRKKPQVASPRTTLPEALSTAADGAATVIASPLASPTEPRSPAAGSESAQAQLQQLTKFINRHQLEQRKAAFKSFMDQKEAEFRAKYPATAAAPTFQTHDAPDTEQVAPQGP
jgi:hypothetical protein